MKIESRANLTINIVGITLILASMALKMLDRGTDFPNLYRIGVYLLFFTLWLVTIRYRVIQRNTRNSLMLVAGLEIFWIIVRSLKYEIAGSADIIRYLWYLYYLPMLMIPAFCLLLGVSMGKPEEHKQRKLLIFFPLASLALFMLVMTNDLHSLVFIIPPGSDGMKVGNYSYGIGYFVITVYIGLCALASYGIILVKCRKPDRRLMRFLPTVPLAILIVVCALNIYGVADFFGLYQFDVTMTSCFCITATLELCIQSGLILTNNGYDRLFAMSGIRAVITDDELSPLIASNSYEEISPENIRKATKKPVLLDSGYRLSSAKIKRGYVLWQDDISELSRVLSGLSETNDYLQGKSSAIQQAYDYQKKERRLIEKNRLYNRILTQTKPEIERYAGLIEQLAEERDPVRARSLAVKIAFVSAFIKRRDNLIFLSEEGKDIDPSELSYCVEESLSNLRLGGAECSCSLSLESPLGFETISRLYEGFYKVVFPAIDDISSVCVYIVEQDGEAVISMRISCKEGREPGFDGGSIISERQDDEWTVTVCARD